MSICPIISTKEKKSDCIGDKCAFFDGCLLLDAHNTADECYDKLDNMQDDIDAAWNEAQGVRIALDDLVRELNSQPDEDFKLSSASPSFFATYLKIRLA